MVKHAKKLAKREEEEEIEVELTEEVLEDAAEELQEEADTTSRSIFLMDDINWPSARMTIRKLIHLAESGTDPIRMYISTYGGDLDASIAIYEVMTQVRDSIPLFTVGVGQIMSAGCLILASGSKGARLMGRHSRLMYHAGKFSFGMNDIQAMKDNYLEACRIEKQHDLLVARETGKTVKEVTDLYQKPRNRDRYLTAAQAKKFGFVDLLTRKSTNSLLQTQRKLA